MTEKEFLRAVEDGAQPLSVVRLEDRDDGRGAAFYLPHEALEWLGGVAEVHLVAARPGAIRGNHVHRRRRELILVRGSGPWELAWRPRGCEVARWTFREPGAVLLAVERGTPHAIKNLGDEELAIVSCSSGRYDPDEPDTEAVRLLT